MGIDGLLTLLKPIIKKQHISTFRQKTLAIDALPWIYKGIYGANLQMGEDVTEKAFLYYILQMIDMLEFYKIKPIFVFDGKSLQAKYTTLEKRKKAKQDNKKKAEQVTQQKEVDEQKKKKALARYINIDQQKLALVMRLLTAKNIQFVIAPYQADSQICKLFKMGIIEAVITEDSDLIVYGVDVILKLKQTGQCDYLTLKNKQLATDQQCPFIKNFCCNFDNQKRAMSAILSGCDYVRSVKGIGIKKAIKLVQQNQNLQKIVQALKKDAKFTDKIPQKYLEHITNAKLIFLLAKTFNPTKKQLEHLNDDIQSQNLKEYTSQQLQKIIGPNYIFTQDHYKGIVNCKTQQKRNLQPLNIKQVYRLNIQNINFQIRGEGNQMIKKQKKQQMIDQTTSICWEGDSCDQSLVFLLKNQNIGQFFLHIETLSQVKQDPKVSQNQKGNQN